MVRIGRTSATWTAREIEVSAATIGHVTRVTLCLCWQGFCRYGLVMPSSTDTQDVILDAVQSVIVRDGVRGASMRQVANEADVSLGLLSYHFDDKDSLIMAAFSRATSALLDASTTAASAVDDADAKVVAFLRGSFTPEFLNSDYLRLRVSLWAVSLTDPELAKVDSHYYDEYAKSLSATIAAARPTLSASEVAMRTTDVVAYTNGLWLDWARFVDDTTLERGLCRAEEMALGA